MAQGSHRAPEYGGRGPAPPKGAAASGARSAQRSRRERRAMRRSSSSCRSAPEDARRLARLPVDPAELARPGTHAKAAQRLLRHARLRAAARRCRAAAAPRRQALGPDPERRGRSAGRPAPAPGAWTHSVPAQILNHPALAASGASPVLSDPALRAQLYPVFTTDFRRTLRNLELVPGTHVELCVDSGQVTAGSASAPISEIELELKQGQPEALLAFAHGLLDDIGLRLEPASKAQRGYALASGAARDAGQGAVAGTGGADDGERGLPRRGVRLPRAPAGQRARPAGKRRRRVSASGQGGAATVALRLQRVLPRLPAPGAGRASSPSCAGSGATSVRRATGTYSRSKRCPGVMAALPGDPRRCMRCSSAPRS